jgi:hypothetical protein
VNVVKERRVARHSRIEARLWAALEGRDIEETSYDGTTVLHDGGGFRVEDEVDLARKEAEPNTSGASYAALETDGGLVLECSLL